MTVTYSTANAGATYQPIANYTLPSATTNYTFSGISASYTDLVLVCSVAFSGAQTYLNLRFNSDSTNSYYTQNLYLTRTSSTVYSASEGVLDRILLLDNYYQGVTANEFCPFEINIMNYSSTATFKNVTSNSGQGTTKVFMDTSTWASLTAVNSITISCGGSPNMITGSSFSLYGIKAA